MGRFWNFFQLSERCCKAFLLVGGSMLYPASFIVRTFVLTTPSTSRVMNRIKGLSSLWCMLYGFKWIYPIYYTVYNICFLSLGSDSIPSKVASKIKLFLPTMKIRIKLVLPAASSPKVAKVKWWMQHYQGPTPKRHYGYSNSREVLTLDKGKLKKHQRKPKDQRIRTADVYKDGNGVKRYKGNANLRPTQILVCIRNVLG